MRYPNNETMRFGMALCTFKDYEVQTGTKKKKKKGGATVEEADYERFTLASPYGYDICLLRKYIREVFGAVLGGTHKRVEASLERWPQVFTVMGEILANTKRKFKFGWTTMDEKNSLFFIESISS